MNEFGRFRPSQELQKEYHKTKRIRELNRLLNAKSKAERDLMLSPYELFLKKLKQKERNMKATIINKQAMKIYRKQKKEMLRRMDMENPEYKVLNKWRLKAYSDVELTRSLNGLTAGIAWVLLKRCWSGYTRGLKETDITLAKYYANGIQKYLWLLEEAPIELTSLKTLEVK